jgi:hypothetical protein
LFRLLVAVLAPWGTPPVHPPVSFTVERGTGILRIEDRCKYGRTITSDPLGGDRKERMEGPEMHRYRDHYRQVDYPEMGDLRWASPVPAQIVAEPGRMSSIGAVIVLVTIVALPMASIAALVVFK